MVMHGSTKHIPRHIKEKKELEGLFAPPPVAIRPGMPKLRSEVEPPTSNMTLYGETPAPPLIRTSVDRSRGNVSVSLARGKTTNTNNHNPSPQPSPISQTTSSLPSEPALLPSSYRPKDWQSVTHAQFKPLPYVATSKEVQLERAAFQRSSELPLNEMSTKVFDPAVGFAGRETQMKTDFKPLEREWYVNRPAIFSIGGGGVKALLAAAATAQKTTTTTTTTTTTGAEQALSLSASGSANRSSVGRIPTYTSAVSGTSLHANPFSGQTTHSDVSLKMSEEYDPHAYESLMKRQFQSYALDDKASEKDRARRWENKKDMVASHFAMGAEPSVQYESSAKVPIAGNKPLVKNQTVTVAPENNPHLVKSVEDARPKGLSIKEIAARKSASSVPLLTKSTPEFQQYGGQLPATSTAYATPAWRADRRPPAIVEKRDVTATSGVRFGHFGEGERRAASALDSYPPSGLAGGGGGGTPTTANFGRRSATPSLGTHALTTTTTTEKLTHNNSGVNNNNKDRGGGEPNPLLANHTNNNGTAGLSLAEKASAARGPQNALRWMSSTKTAYKGFQYQ